MKARYQGEDVNVLLGRNKELRIVETGSVLGHLVKKEHRWAVQNNFGIIATGSTREEAIQVFMDRFELVWQTMAANPFTLEAPYFMLFVTTHLRHTATMSASDQEKYAFEKVKHVTWNPEFRYLTVYYDDTKWHYNELGDWWQ